MAQMNSADRLAARARYLMDIFNYEMDEGAGDHSIYDEYDLAEEILYFLYEWDVSEIMTVDEVISLLDFMIDDGYDMTGWTLSDIPGPLDFIFSNEEKRQTFELYYLYEEERWGPAYVKWIGSHTCEVFGADTIEEAVRKDQTWNNPFCVE